MTFSQLLWQGTQRRGLNGKGLNEGGVIEESNSMEVAKNQEKTKKKHKNKKIWNR